MSAALDLKIVSFPPPRPGSGPKTMAGLVEDFLTDLRNANRSPHTILAYKSDLAAFTSKLPNGAMAGDVGVEALRFYFAGEQALSQASRARHQASLGAFFKWAYRHEVINSNPMELLERVKLPDPVPRGVSPDDVKKVLVVIPASKSRDLLLFKLLTETGLRISEALGLHVEDLSLDHDDERMSVLGKGQKRRTILLDDRRLVKLLKNYLKETGYKNGPVFRAGKNAVDDNISYQAVNAAWRGYCQEAGVGTIKLHQLRHTHATTLINSGVSVRTIQRRLGHVKPETTFRYAEQSDVTSDREIRAWRRRQGTQ